MRTAIWVLILAGCITYGCKAVYPVTKEDHTVEVNEEILTRGKHLTMAICGKCHLGNSSESLIGARMMDLPKIFGKVYSGNITAGKEYGIGNYTDAELSYLIKTGISRKGRYIPYMVRPNMADEDVNAIIAYLHSGDDPVKPVDSITGKTRYSFFGKIAMRLLAGKPFEYRKGSIRPSSSDSIALGAYLVNVLGCFHCHSKSMTKLDHLEPERSKGYMAGGMKMRTITGERMRASNLTPDKTTGIGNYSMNEFIVAVKNGINKENKILRYPMQIYSELEDDEVAAIYAYLNTLKAVSKKIKH